MPKHTTMSGHVIEYDKQKADVGAFLDRLRAMLEDAKVGEQEMIAIAYSTENPILAQGLFPGRGTVTREVLADPVYHLMADLVARKHVQVSGGDFEAIAVEHTLSVADAARELGITEDAVRKAIAGHRLSSWVRDGRHMLSPRAVKAFALLPKKDDRLRPGAERADDRSEAEKRRDARAAAKTAPARRKAALRAAKAPR